jgi:hypothetical protein
MKRFLSPCLAVACLLAAMQLPVNADPSAGYVDFGKLTPPSSGGQFVEVNISSNIISLVARLAKDSDKDVQDIAEVVKGLQHIRVNVIGMDDGNREDLKAKVKTVRDELDKQSWERVVTAQEKDQDVVVQIKTRGDEAIQGVVVTVFDGDKQAVLVNVVGDIQPEKLAALGEKFDIEPLKKLHIAKNHSHSS